MSIFSFFIKEKIKSQRDISFENEINKLYKEKKYDEVISRALTFRADEQELSYHIKKKVALSHYYKNDFEKSLTLFEEIASIKNDVESWFNVLMSLMPLKKTQQGKAVFDKILTMHKGLDPQQPRELAIPNIRFYYANGLADNNLFNEALEQLEEIKKIYMTIVITDDTFVYIRGIPFLSSTLDLAKRVFKGLCSDISDSDFIKELINKVDDEGKKTIKNSLENECV